MGAFLTTAQQLLTRAPTLAPLAAQASSTATASASSLLSATLLDETAMRPALALCTVTAVLNCFPEYFLPVSQNCLTAGHQIVLVHTIAYSRPDGRTSIAIQKCGCARLGIARAM